jgi:spore coat protein U-like protein
VLVALLASAPWSEAEAATVNVAASATINKPLIITSMQNLDLGTIVLGTGSWSSATVAISRDGAFSCAAPLVCIGPSLVAKYHLQGSNSAVVTITAPDVILRNSSDPAQTLTLAVDNPGTIRLPNSGNKGLEVGLGGSIRVSSTTAAGEYTGTFNVTMDYQ